MLYAIVFICAAGLAPTSCDEATARRFEHVPEGSALPFRCFQNAQAWAAENITIKPDEYPVVRCSRHEFGSRAG